MVESGLHGLDLLELVLHGIDVFLLEDLGVDGRLVSVGGIDVPGSELYVVEVGQRDYVFIVEIFLVFAATYADFVILSHRADGLGETLAGHENASHESGSYSSETHYHDAQLTFGLLCFCCHS